MMRTPTPNFPRSSATLLLVVVETLVFDLGGVSIWGGKGLAAPTPLLVAASALYFWNVFIEPVIRRLSLLAARGD